MEELKDILEKLTKVMNEIINLSNEVNICNCKEEKILKSLIEKNQRNEDTIEFMAKNSGILDECHDKTKQLGDKLVEGIKLRMQLSNLDEILLAKERQKLSLRQRTLIDKELCK